MAADTQTENSKIRPNHTQTPNVYFDQYMAFLTGEEWKCLCYTVRRTMGFQRPSAQISTVQYASGLTTKDGKRLDFGTGLSRPAVAKAVTALVTFGLLIEVKLPRGNAGGVYELQLDDTKIDHDAIMNRSTEQAQKKRQRTAKMLQVRLTAVSGTYSNKSDLQGAVSATDSNAASATYSNPVARKKEKESLGNKDSLQPAAGASVAGASEVAAKAVEPDAKREGVELPEVEPPIVKEPELKSPLQSSAKGSPLPDGYSWFMTAGDNYKIHAAQPTPSGKQIKPLCGAPGNYAVPVTDKTPIGNRQPCLDCQHKAAGKAALRVAGAKATQPHILLIEAWHNAHPTDIKPIGKPNIVRNVKTAKELSDAGITPERVVAFMDATYPGYIEWARNRGTSAVMSLEHIKNNIRAWEAKKPNGNIKNGRYQPDDYGYDVDPILSRD